MKECIWFVGFIKEINAYYYDAECMHKEECSEDFQNYEVCPKCNRKIVYMFPEE